MGHARTLVATESEGCSPTPFSERREGRAGAGGGGGEGGGFPSPARNRQVHGYTTGISSRREVIRKRECPKQPMR